MYVCDASIDGGIGLVYSFFSVIVCKGKGNLYWEENKRFLETV